MKQRIAAAAAVATLCASIALAVAPLPPYSAWPCNPNAAPGQPFACTVSDPNDCYSYRAYSIRDALQIRTSDGRSPRDTQSPDPTYGVCPSPDAWCLVGPQLGSVHAEVVQNPNGGQDLLFDVPYDVPNNYCQVDADSAYPACGAGIWPPKFVIEIPPTRLMIVDASTSEIVVQAPAVFERGTWKPRINVGCGGWNRSYRIIVSNSGSASPSCGANPTAEFDMNVNVPPAPAGCNPDRWCPTCGVGNQPPTGGGNPVAFGSGDVSVTLPLLSIARQPLGLHFSISYHSEPAIYPAFFVSAMGNGWTYTFNDQIHILDSSRTVLYRVDGTGHETQYEGLPNGPWFPTSPAEITGREQVTLVNGNLVLTDVDGNVTTFKGTTGQWLSTADRWGNTLTADLDNTGALAGVRDAEGREITFTYGTLGLASVALPTGETWRFGYDGVSLSAIFDPIHTGATPWRTLAYVADAAGVPRLLSEVRDDGGALMEGHAYDAAGRGTTSVLEGGRDALTVTYNGPGLTHATTAIDGATSQQSDYTMRYKGGRWLPTSIVGTCMSCGASSDTQSFTIDDTNRVTSRTDGVGHITRYSYDAYGDVVSRIDAFGTGKQRTTVMLYEDAAWPSFVTKIIEPSAVISGASKITTRSWNANETVLTEAQSGYLAASDTAPTVYTSTTTFDAHHRVVAFDGPRTDVQDVTTTAYYPDGDPNLARRGRVQQVTDAAGLVRTFADYDIYGSARSLTDPNGVSTTVATDARGRVTSSTNNPVAGDPNESSAYTSTSSYDTRDRLTRSTMPRGNVVSYVYEDGTNRLTDMVRLNGFAAEAERRHQTLNLAGDKVREEDQSCAAPATPCSSWTTQRSESFLFDDHNRLAALQHPIPAGSQVVYVYDADGKLASVQDENHTRPNTIYGYDELDRLTSVTQTLATAPGGIAITRYGYDVMDNLTSVTDPNGNTTSYTYDDFRRMTSLQSPVTGTTTYTYDAAGNLTSSTDARGAVTTRSYDALNRLLTAASTLGMSTEAVTYAYDDPTAGNYGKGRLASMSDPSGSTSYAYERRGLLRAEVKTILGDTYTTRYQYDANGNRSGITYPSGRQVTYAFDYADRPSSAASGTTTYISAAAYAPFGPETSLTYGSGAVTRTATYDQRYRITGFSVTAGAAPLASYAYGLDAAGNITAITDALDPRYSRAFGYDDLYRLTQANSGIGLWGSGSYTYDALGNRLAASIGTRGSSYMYVGSTSKLASVTESGSTRAVTYDPAGNEQQVGTSSFVYSPRNYLDTADGLHYVYDGSGVRVAQVGVSVGPLITTEPQSQPVCPGGTATLSVVASGATAYQWQSFDGTNWTDIPFTSSVAVVSPAAPTQYRVLVSNAAASTTSSVATVTPIAVATEPSSGILYGDVNHDGAVDSTDVALLRAVLTGKQTLSVPTAVADLNGDGAIDALDLSLLNAYATQTIACLPQLTATATPRRAIAATQTAPNPTQYFFYTPEKNLLSQTAIQAAGGLPPIAVDTIWFSGHPVAEERLTPTQTRYTFTDHLGTPFLQTDPTALPLWRAEYEPFGTVYAMRTGSAPDQRLRFPGQEFDAQTPEREYNIFRWYRSSWGRYASADRLGLVPTLFGIKNLFGYADANPIDHSDRLGLYSIDKGCSDTCGPDNVTSCYNNPQKINCAKGLVDEVKQRVFFNSPCRKALQAAGKWQQVAGSLMPSAPYPRLTCNKADCTGSEPKYFPATRSIPMCKWFFAYSPPAGAQSMLHEFLHDAGVGDGTPEQTNILTACYPGFAP